MSKKVVISTLISVLLLVESFLAIVEISVAYAHIHAEEEK
jgi:hypothetical protein